MKKLVVVLIVLGALGALTVFAVPTVRGWLIWNELEDARTQTDQARAYADLKIMELALELYYEENGQYPSSLSMLTANWEVMIRPSLEEFNLGDPSGAVPQTGFDYTLQADGSYMLCTQELVPDDVSNCATGSALDS